MYIAQVSQVFPTHQFDNALCRQGANLCCLGLELSKAFFLLPWKIWQEAFVSKPEGTEIRGTASRVHKSCNRKHGNLVDNPPNQQSYEVTSQICRKHKIIGQSAGKHIKNDQELSLGNIGKFTRSSHQVLHLPCCGLGALAWRWNRWLVAQLPMSESLESAAIPTAWKAFVMRCSGLCSATAMPGEAKAQGGTCFVTSNRNCLKRNCSNISLKIMKLCCLQLQLVSMWQSFL